MYSFIPALSLLNCLRHSHAEEYSNFSTVHIAQLNIQSENKHNTVGYPSRCGARNTLYPPPRYEIFVPIKRQTNWYQNTSLIHGMNSIQEQSSSGPKEDSGTNMGFSLGFYCMLLRNDNKRLPVDKASQSTRVEFQVSGSSDNYPRWKWSWWFSSLHREKLETSSLEQRHVMISKAMLKLVTYSSTSTFIEAILRLVLKNYPVLYGNIRI